jgi:hypothetical protein
MEQLLLATNKRKTVSGAPDMGYNFSQGRSTGKTAIAVANATDLRDLSTIPLAGYDKAAYITTAAAITPVSPVNVGVGDFTLEIVVRTSVAAAGYNFFFYAEAGGVPRMEIRLADNGYGNRLQVSLNPNTASDVYSSATTRAQFINGWHHVAMVREKGRIRMYLDGVLQPLATGTNAVYTSDRSDPRTIDSVAKVQLGHAQYPANALVPEFAFYQGVKYNRDFIPSFPLVA